MLAVAFVAGLYIYTIKSVYDFVDFLIHASIISCCLTWKYFRTCLHAAVPAQADKQKKRKRKFLGKQNRNHDSSIWLRDACFSGTV